MDFEEVEITEEVVKVDIKVFSFVSIKGAERHKETLKDKVFRKLSLKDRVAVRKLQNLPIFNEVHNRLLHCEPTAEIARYIHDEGYLPNYSHRSLVRIIDIHKQTIPKAHFIAVNASKKTNMLQRAQAYMHRQLDILQEVEEIAKYSIERINRLKAADRSMNLPIPMEGFGKEVGIFMSIAKYLEDLRQRSGLDAQSKWPEQDQTVIDIGKAYDDPKISETIRNPASRYKILKVMEKIERMSSRQLPSEKELLSSSDSKPILSSQEEKLVDSKEVLQVEEIDLSLIQKRSIEAED